MNVISAQCTGCHSAAAASSFGNLDLMTDPVASLVGVDAKGDKCGGKGKLLNDGASPATGIFIDKISGTPGCGDAMPPPPLPALSSSDVDCLKAWAGSIASGSN